jgi:Ras family protein
MSPLSCACSVAIATFISSRQIDPTEAQEFAKLNNAAWIETSAKKNINVGTHIVTQTFLTDPDFGLARAFELCLNEIEKLSTQNATFKPPPLTNKSICLIM